MSQLLLDSPYLQPYFPWYIPPPPPYTQNFFLWALKNFSYRQELEKFRISWGPSLLGGPNFLFGREGARPFPSINNESCKLKNRWWQNYLFYVCMLTVLTFLGKVSVSKFSKCPFKLSETRLLMFGNNSMKVWIPFDMSSEYVNIIW